MRPLAHKESDLRGRVPRCARARRWKFLNGVCDRGAVAASVLAVRCKYQRIQGLFKWLAHGEGTNYKDFLVNLY